MGLSPLEIRPAKGMSADTWGRLISNGLDKGF